jgi:pimeloyl-ACP methyl ester carboxylesterase
MLARIQQVVAFSLVALLVGGYVGAVLLGLPAYAAVVPTVSILGYVAALGVEFWMLARSYDREDLSRPRASQIVRAWIGESLAAPRAFLWRQPFLSQRTPDNLIASPAPRRGVLFVHGFFCNRGLWNPWLERLREERIPFVALSLEPVFGSIDSYRESIAAAALQLRQATSLTPVVVAHSMGGLAVRAWLANAGDENAVHRVVTIASPHAGTRLARHSFAANIAEMRIGSAWLTSLWALESPSMRARFICFWGHCDNIVFPTRSATLPEADNRHLEATAHVQMVLHPAVLETLLELVNAPLASAG